MGIILNSSSMIETGIVGEICSHATQEGSGYRNWYCGITADPKQRLFEEHNVPKENAWWIHRRAQSEQNARDTEAHLLSLGFKGGPGGGDASAAHVYAYRILNSTAE